MQNQGTHGISLPREHRSRSRVYSRENGLIGA
jgi:hypothetical protein